MSIEGVPNGLMSVDVQTLNLLWDKDYVSNSLRGELRNEYLRRKLKSPRRRWSFNFIVRVVFLIVFVSIGVNLFITATGLFGTSSTSVISKIIKLLVGLTITAAAFRYALVADRRARASKRPSGTHSSISVSPLMADARKFAAENQADLLLGIMPNIENVSEADEKGYTLLMLASANGAADAVDVLLRFNADPLATTPKGHSALFFAASEEVAITLIRHLGLGRTSKSEESAQCSGAEKEESERESAGAGKGKTIAAFFSKFWWVAVALVIALIVAASLFKAPAPSVGIISPNGYKSALPSVAPFLQPPLPTEVKKPQFVNESLKREAELGKKLEELKRKVEEGKHGLKSIPPIAEDSDRYDYLLKPEPSDAKLQRPSGSPNSPIEWSDKEVGRIDK